MLLKQLFKILILICLGFFRTQNIEVQAYRTDPIHVRLFVYVLFKITQLIKDAFKYLKAILQPLQLLPHLDFHNPHNHPYQVDCHSRFAPLGIQRDPELKTNSKTLTSITQKKSS